MTISDPRREELARRLAALSPEQRRLLAELRGPRSGPAAVPPILVRSPAPSYPLSFGQQQLWFLAQVDPESPAYNVPVVAWLAGDLEPARLGRGLELLAVRHESLRTRFVDAAGRPAQVIDPPPRLDLPLADLSALPAAARPAEAGRLEAAEARRPFDLRCSPLLRRLLVRLGPREHRLLVALPHALTDGLSMSIFFRDLAALCVALPGGTPPALPPLRVQAADHAVWQRERLSGPFFDGLLAWWREALDGAPAVLDLPADRPRLRVRGDAGHLQRRTLPQSVLDGARRAGAREGATLFMTLLAAFAALLHRWTEREDLLVGAPVIGRDHPDLENVIGFFINTLVLRLRPAGALSFRDLLAQVRRACLDAFAHQEIPFDRLVDALEVERDPSRPPLVQVIFSLQPSGLPGTELAGARIERFAETRTGTAKADLTLGVDELAEGGLLWLEASSELFEAATIERFSGHWLRLLDAAVSDPALLLADLPLLSSAERHELLVEWNDTAADVPPRRLDELFAAQAALMPAAPAVVSEAGTLSYLDLDRQANRLARHLRSLGLSPEERVAVALPRSPEAVVALLAVWKAGGTWVPVDPSWPAERIGLILEDSGARLLLTLEESEEVAALRRSVRLDRDAAEIARQSAAPVRCAVDADHLAYVIYTSGSTGRPKGVMVSHRALANLVLGWARAPGYGLGPGGRILGLAAPAFDVALGETALVLAHGAVLHCAAPERLLGAALGDLLEERAITHLIIAPATLATVPLRELPALRVLDTGADVVPPELVRAWAAPGRCAFDGYGPTEATVMATFARVTGDEPRLPIGLPLPNLRALVLDDGMQPVPLGVAGELYLGGVGLARGYLGRPDLTAERFLPDPFAEVPGERLYRTGDRVRRLSDGRLDFLGRSDRQVQVHGIRVELEEVEAALRSHPEVADAVVAPGPEGDLCCWIVPGAGTAPQPSGLRAFLRRALPAFMVPSAFMLLDDLPRTSAGKPDLQALAARGVEAARSLADLPYAPPRTPGEEALAHLWEELLRVERVGIEEDFFALGGDSILALQLVSRAREQGFRLVPRDLFESPTVAGLAAAAQARDAAGTGAGSAQTVALRPRSTLHPSEAAEEVLPLTPLQAGMLFHSLAAPDSGVYVEQASCRIEGELDPEAFAVAWREVLARHPALRLSFRLAGERPVQVVHPRVDLPWRAEDWRGLSAAARRERLRDLLRQDARRGFALERPPLLRLFLAREEEDAWRVVWTCHHLLLDGWSVPLVLREVFALYAGAALPPPASGELAGAPEPEDAAAAEAFWRETLAGFAGPTPLDALRCLRGGPAPDGPAEPDDLVARDCALPAEATARLAELARSCRVTLATVAAGAWALVLARTAGRRDVVFGTVVAGRPPHLAGEAAPVGLWINSLPLRVQIDPAEPLAPWLRRLHALQGEMISFQRTSLADVQRWSGMPLFASLFAFENYPADPALLAEAGLRVTELETIERTNYPLNVAVVPGEVLRVRLSWDRRLLDPEAVARLLGRLEALLAALGQPGAAERPLGVLPGLGEEERQTLLRLADGAAAPLPAERFHELFEARAALDPSAPAVVGAGEALTYGELDRRANRLARHLVSLGLQAGERVAVALERSPASFVALLAVWKAGGVWVPLDLTWPAARLGLVLEDSGAAFLIAEEETVQVAERLRIVRPVRDAAAISGRSDVPVRSVVEPDQLAYVLFTSGSTGRPKGVMVPHRALANHALAWARVPGFRSGPGDRVLQLGPLGFDISLGEAAWALPYGAALHLAPPGRLLGEALGQLLEERAITHLHVVPAALGAVPLRPLPALRVLCVGADVVPPELARAWAAPGRSVFHAYGPTEATVIATVAALHGNEERLSIGRPLANVRALVLGDGLDLAPLGVPGELCLGGAGLARGYLDRPDLTAERFIPDPFAAVPGARLYRSGDRVRRRLDGELELLGRIDRQVKVRGSRVEPEEVEAALRSHPEVAEAAVGPVPRGLCAWVVPRPGAAPVPGDLRAFLRDRLPEFMLPSAFVVLPEIPRTPSGKLDRHSLPPPEDGARPETGEPFAAPRTPAEEALARIWAEVLGAERVGVHDDFFVLGGDSILSLQVIGRAAAAGLRLDPRMIFAHPTVAELAALAERIPRAPADIEEGDGAGPAPLTPIQRWFFAQGLPEPQHWNMPLLLALPEGADPVLLERAVGALVDCHGALRARFPRDGRDRRQEIAPAGGPVPFAVVDLAALPEVRRAAAVTAGCTDLQAGLDLESGPLFRTVLFAVPAGERPRLFLLAHHLIVDGVSWRVILTDLMAAKARLPAPPVSWRRWAERLAAAAAGEDLRSELPLWEEVVHAGAPALPVDLPGRPEQNTAGAAEQVAVELDEETTRALLQRVPEVHRAGIEEALLSALVRALEPWLGEPVLFLDLEGHGRQGEAVVVAGIAGEEPLDLSRTVGWFTTVSPVRLDLGGAGTPGAALRAVKETLRGLLQRGPSKGLGYGLLRWLGGEETAARLTPAVPPGLLFNYLGQLDAALGAGGIGLAPEPAGPDHAPGGRRSHLLEINAYVLGGRLGITWAFSPAFHRRATIERLAEAFQEALQDLAASREEAVATPADFPEAELDQESLARLLAHLGSS